MPRILSRVPASQAGFSLIEALVSILVLSFGLLALAGFQLRVLSDSSGASHQNIAAQLASEMAERIRANPVKGATSGSPYKVDFTPAPESEPSPSCADMESACNQTELAAWDLWAWKRRVAAALPGGLGDVQSKDSAGGLLFVHVAWDDPAAIHPIAPNAGCPEGKSCQEIIVAVPEP
jgi:type IV pilus assembly protein PilV